MCEGHDLYGCVGKQETSYANQNGYFVFLNVEPGNYTIMVEDPTSFWWLFYLDRRRSSVQTVRADEILILDPWIIYRHDLHALAPRVGENVSQAKPHFKWQAYPDAAYYEISVYDAKNHWIVQNKRIESNDFTPEEPMVACEYHWYVEVFNANGVKISETRSVNTTTPHWYFSLINLPTSC